MSILFSLREVIEMAIQRGGKGSGYTLHFQKGVDSMEYLFHGVDKGRKPLIISSMNDTHPSKALGMGLRPEEFIDKSPIKRR